MSELATQAERYEQLSRKFTSLYHQPSDDQFLVVSDLETEIDENIDDLPSQAFLRRIYDGFGKSPAFLLELGIHTISQERTLAIRRINYFGSEQGLHFLKTLPIEKDIENPKEDLDEFCRNYGQRFQAIKNQVIIPYALQPNESLEKLQTEFGLQLTEEIVSGGEGLSRGGEGLSKFAATLPEEEEEEVILYRPILLLNIPTDFREDELPIIPHLQEEISEIHLIQPGRETVEGEPGALLRAIFDFGSDLLANVQKRYSTNEEQHLVDIYKSFTDEIEKIIGTGIDWSSLLSEIRNVVDKLSAEKEDDSTEKKAIREVLEFARRRSTSFLIGQWYPEFIDKSMQAIQKASKRPILDFIDQSGDLGILGPEGTIEPEQALEMILKNFDQILGQIEKEEQKTSLRSIRSSIQSRMLDPNVLEEFADYCKDKMRISCNTGSMTFDPARNVSEILANLEKFRRAANWEAREIEKVRQSVNLSVDELNTLQVRRVSTDDSAKLFEYLTYWGIDPPGGSLIRFGTLMIASADPSWILPFQFDREIGVVGLLCLESTSREAEDTAAELHDFKSLQAVLSRLKGKFKNGNHDVARVSENEVVE
ncbi:MAG: hypothetical protein ACXACI_01685 [Candidatus Hodarchaeales archaeon]|jgi:hypothetical protein